MKTIKITVMKQVIHQDLIDEYELPLENPCPLKVGDVFYIDENLIKPANLCDSAFKTLKPFIENLFNNTKRIYGKWMKNNNSYMISCDDGFRPVSFLIEIEA